MQQKIKGTVVITRPLHQAQNLALLIQKNGGKVIFFPTLEILPIKNNVNLQKAAKNIDQFDIVIFVSANAVDYFLKAHTPSSRDDAIAIAVGSGTAHALCKGKITAIIPENHSSEGILNLKELQNIKDKSIALFCGENSKPLLKKVLLARGATVEEIVCYRRQCPDVNVDKIATAWREAGVNYLISTSTESLQNLYFIFAKIDSTWLLQIPLLVVSDSMSALAQQLGFKTIIRTQGASDDAICKSLRKKTVCSKKTT